MSPPKPRPNSAIGRVAAGVRRAGRTLPEPVGRPLRRLVSQKSPSRGPETPPASDPGPDKSPGPGPVGGVGELLSDLRAVTASPDGLLQLNGWAFRAGQGNPRSIAVIAVGPAETAAVVVEAILTGDEEVNRADADRTRDRSGASFRVELPVAELVAAGPEADHDWRIEIRVRDEAGEVQEPFAAVARFSSAAAVPPFALGPATEPDALIVVQPTDRDGLLVRVQRPDVRAGLVRVDPDGLQVRLRFRGSFRPRQASLVHWPETRAGRRTGERHRVSLPLNRSGSEARIELARLLDLGPEADGRWGMEVSDLFGQTRAVRWSPEAGRHLGFAGPGPGRAWVVQASPTGLLRLDWGREARQVESAELVPGEPARLRVRLAGLAGPFESGSAPTPDRFVLESERQRIPARTVGTGTGSTGTGSTGTAGEWSDVVVEFDLAGPGRFSSEVLPLTSGRYRLLLDAQSLGIAPALSGQLGRRVELTQFGARVERSGRGEFAMRVSAPRPAGEAGRVRMLQLAATAETATTPIVEAVLYDCFDGRFTGDSPGAISRELKVRRPDLDEFWVVADFSVPVPAGARAVVVNSRQHFEIRSTARFVVTNVWLNADFRRRAGQHVLQTWHGTPFKRLGTDRIGTDQSADYRSGLAEQTRQWTWLVSQNSYSTEIFARTYAYDGPIVELGYPRNDVLSEELDDRRREVLRARIGLRPGERVVLFAPTWREDGSHATGNLDYSLLSKRLGPNVRILVRGHANTMRGGSDRSGHGLIDVTSYPELTDLLAVSEMLVTDYSSMMFDYAITGKPMVFFVPDLHDYVDRDRGAYFDLAVRAPGPLVTDTSAVADEIERAAAGVPPEYEQRYRDWRETFTPFDDGHAAERVVDLLLTTDD